MRTATLLLTSLALFASCAGSLDPAGATKAGEKALGSQDFAAALEHFDGALASLGDDTSNKMYLRAKLGQIEALASTDAARAVADLTALASSMPGKVDARDFSRIAGRMGSAGKYEEGAKLLEAAKAALPDADFDSAVKSLGDQAKAAGSEGALDALSGLGYVGDN